MRTSRTTPRNPSMAPGGSTPMKRGSADSISVVEIDWDKFPADGIRRGVEIRGDDRFGAGERLPKEEPENMSNVMLSEQQRLTAEALRLTRRGRDYQQIALFRDVNPLDWEDWRWQMKNRVTK